MRATSICIALLLAACSINHKSDGYACEINNDCEGGRVCSGGFCVVNGSQIDGPRSIDAPRIGDANTGCPAQCSSCNTSQKTCTINCMTSNCQNTVVCPIGYKCDIQCNTDNACRNGINCTMAASCNIDCIAKSSCENVQCGAGPCAVTCSGPSACKNVSCNASCACDVLCTGSQSCSSGISCTSFACRGTNGIGCTSVPALCHSCQ
ncbi:MAG TPA: hypothetical protein VL326_11890 [Kofleriaceae bacterium]|jgi:hypothetical protein|nr:hypothetical protein [Kofleriaceae bacterium]